MNFNQFFETIERYSTIAIFRHVSPDGDALGSQYGLKLWIESNYPDKKVVALGKRHFERSFFPPSDQIEDHELKDALAIICDTANRERVDDERFSQCREVMKIDHHPVCDAYGDYSFVEDKASATCEILTEILMNSSKKCPQEAASYLYAGLIADTQQFSIPSVTAKTLRCAAFLSELGVDIAKCNQRMFSSTLNDFKYEAVIKNNCQIIDGRLAYSIMEQSDYEQFGLGFQKAKEKVFALSRVEEFEIWVLFTQNPEENGLFNGSIRSKSTVINDIAAKFNGGGHAFASGVKRLTYSDIQDLLGLLNARLEERNNENQGQ